MTRIGLFIGSIRITAAETLGKDDLAAVYSAATEPLEASWSKRMRFLNLRVSPSEPTGYLLLRADLTLDTIKENRLQNYLEIGIEWTAYTQQRTPSIPRGCKSANSPIHGRAEPNIPDCEDPTQKPYKQSSLDIYRGGKGCSS